MDKTLIRPLAMYPLLVGVKNHDMTSVSRSLGVQERDASKRVITACVTGTRAVVMRVTVTPAT